MQLILKLVFTHNELPFDIALATTRHETNNKDEKLVLLTTVRPRFAALFNLVPDENFVRN